MIRHCEAGDFEAIWAIINDGAQAYKGVIPQDRWPEPDTTPYISQNQLREEIADGVEFWGWDEGGSLVGVMGSQAVEDVTLIRHAYVRGECQKRGIGADLLAHLMRSTITPVLVGAWTHATWAIAFYQKHGFAIVDAEVKDRLLNRYWSVPARQVETSVAVADVKWMSKLE